MTAPTGPTKTYASKRDAWLVVLLYVGILAMLVAIGPIWAEPASIWFRLGLTTVVGLSTGFMLWVLSGTNYTLRADAVLVIRTGPFRWTVRLAEITEIVPTRNPLSSPALSLDRIKIRYRGRFVMISPEDKRAFMRDVASRVEHLQVEGDRVVRRDL